jgi:hypothetical protein
MEGSLERLAGQGFRRLTLGARLTILGRVMRTSKRCMAAMTALLALTAGLPACLAADATPTVAPDPAAVPSALHLVVRHALDAGRLVVRVGEDAFLSTPLKMLPGHAEKLLSVPGGEQTITVQWFDGAGRVLAQKQTHADISAAAPAVLDVAAAMISGVANLSVSWRERP